jgi:hypothetical protein
MKKPRPVPAVLPPALLLKWQTLAIALIVLLVPFFVPIPVVLRRHPIFSPLGDQLHVVLLAGVALLLYWRGPLTGRLWPTAVAASLIGGAIEFVQIPFGRNACFGDFVLDVIGIGLVAGYVLWRGHGLKVGLGLIIALLLIFPARLYHLPFVVAASYRSRDIFPTLTDFEGRRDGWIWGGNSAGVTVVPVDDSPEGTGHVVRVVAGPPANWPGAEMRRFPHDWSQYETLLIDVRLVPEGATEPGVEQRFGVRVDDFVGRHEDTWISDSGVATTDWQTIRIPLRDRAVTDGNQVSDRIFDLHDVDRILLYLNRPAARTVLEFDNLRLE